MKSTRKIFLLLSPVILILLASAVILKTEGAHPGSTGAPGDETCAQAGCHSDAQVIQNAVGNNTLQFSSIDSSYFPGQTYSITIKTTGSGINPITKFGFEVVALKDADSLNTGQFILSEPLRTQIINHLYLSDTRYSVTHKGAGTPALATNATQWTINWTAPPANVGTVTFWYATNHTNNNSQNTGDRIYLHSFQIKPNPAIYLKENKDEFELKCRYQKETRVLNLSFMLIRESQVQFKLTDINGRNIYTSVGQIISGKQNEVLKLDSQISSGTYFLQIIVNGKISTKKFIID